MRKKPPEPPRSTEPCAVPGCPLPGEYKAPRSRFETGEYQYLCLDHIREFNRAWDYFEGWNREQIEEFSHSLVHGHRPTWKPGSQPLFTNETLRDSFFRMMGERPPEGERKPDRRMNRPTREALAVLDLEPGATRAMVKAQYKKLVKKYHPDVNRDDKAAEEMFKRVTDAYSLLSKTLESETEG